MIYLIILLIGLTLGIFLKEKFINLVNKYFINKYIIKQRNHYKVKFNGYIIVHRYGCNTSELIKTDSVEVSLSAKDEDEASKLVNKIVEDNFKVEIESVELVS